MTNFPTMEAQLRGNVEWLQKENARLREEINILKAEPATGQLATALLDVGREVQSAMKWPLYNSAHEGYAVLLEEVDELKAHVWTKQRDRDLVAMRAEVIQVAAVAVRFVLSVCDERRGRK